jgi:hypothetical protein
MTNKYVLTRTEGGVATVNLNRPESFNALNAELVAELDQVFAELAADSDVKAIILHGEKNFAAGADIGNMVEFTPEEARDFSFSGIFARIEACPKPVIAAIEGFALGGGMELARALGKTPARVNKEIYGFLCNRIFSVITKEACYLLDQGIASVEDIDNAIKGALGHPMGPLELLDMTGIDLEYHLGMERYRETGNLADKPSPALVERYAKGDYGRKTGKGFYEYNAKK